MRKGRRNPDFLPCVAPYYFARSLVCGCFHHLWHRKRRDYEISAPLGPTPKPSRPRALTLPLVNPTEEQNTADQTQSYFLTKLPLEIRRMVYELVLGSLTLLLRIGFHFQGRGRGPFGRRCTYAIRKHYMSYEHCTGDMGLCPTLLRTCRQIYSEAIGTLYSANHFDIASAQHSFLLPLLPCYFVPQRLQQIRSLSVFWLPQLPVARVLPGYEGDAQGWTRSWNVIGQMTGLQTLYVRIRCDHRLWLLNEADIFEPIKSITAPTSFVIILPNTDCKTTVDLRPSRCVLELPTPEFHFIGEGMYLDVEW